MISPSSGRREGALRSDYSLEEYLTIKHVMSDISGAADKDWHRTIFTMR